jgi:hypothetical protein
MVKDGNFIYGSGYPRKYDPLDMGMEDWIRSWISWSGYPLTREVGTGRGFSVDRYPMDIQLT